MRLLRVGDPRGGVRYENACDIVAGSTLVSALKSRYGEEWKNLEWAKTMLASFAGALEGTDSPDHVLDEMKAMAARIRGDHQIPA